MEGRSILITGATGQVALPLAQHLATTNTVWAAARFTNADARKRLEQAGVRCVQLDLAGDDLGELPDVDHVLNFAVSRSDDFDADLRCNAEAVGLLMRRYGGVARSFLHCSSTAVYQPKGHDSIRETDPLGDNHRVMFPTYSIVKIAAEAVARTSARTFDLATVIARLNVPYGDSGGWPYFHLLMMRGGMAIPVHRDAPSLYNPIHEDDIAAMAPRLLELATVPAVIVNWGGDEQVSIEEWCTFIGELTGVEPQFEATDTTLESVAVDLSRMHELVGHTDVHWKDGMRRMVEANP